MTTPTPTRRATLHLGPDTATGNVGLYVSDSGLRLPLVQLPWRDDAHDVSRLPPAPGGPDFVVLCDWRWSEAHGKNLYHVEDPNRPGAELHSANVPQQLKGCGAPGLAAATFAANSIAPGMPPVDTDGVTESVAAVAKLEADMRDPKTGEQVPFILTITWRAPDMM